MPNQLYFAYLMDVSHRHGQTPLGNSEFRDLKMKNNIPPPKTVFLFKILGPKSYFFYVCLELGSLRADSDWTMWMHITYVRHHPRKYHLWITGMKGGSQLRVCYKASLQLSFAGSSAGKESACNAKDPSWILWSGRSPGEGIDSHSSILGLPLWLRR